jgi:hypothetical protein
MIVPGQPFGMLGRQINDRKRECAEAIEPNYAKLVVNCYENASHIAFLVLPGAKMEPVIQRRDTARKCTPIVLAKRFDRGNHNRSAEQTAMLPESLDEARSRLGFALDCRDKGVAICAHQDYPLMFFQ